MPGEGSAEGIRTLLVLQSNHLDMGYKDMLPGLIDLYFDEYFPRAAAVGAELRKAGGQARLRWMTHPYLVSLYVSCPPGLGLHCPGEDELAVFQEAVTAGDIWWQGFPANAELAIMDPSLIEASVAMTHELDDLFGVPRKRAVSTRDVPGMDRSAIPVLRRSGIDLLSEGHNGSPWPANVPPAFLWVDRCAAGSHAHVREGVSPPSGESIPVLWTRNYGDTGVVLALPNSTVAVAYNWRGDNAGPPETAKEVQDVWDSLAKLAPGAEVRASTFEEIAGELQRVQHLLPVVEREVGDTWIFGCASDPAKLAQTRAAQRHRAACAGQAAGPCLDPGRLGNFSRLLSKNAEHTWGLSVFHFSGAQYKWYQNSEFHALRRTSYEDPANKSAAFVKLFEDSWRDQRRFGLDAALAAVAGTQLERDIRSEFAALRPPRPSLEGLVPVWTSSVDGARGVHPDSIPEESRWAAGWSLPSRGTRHRPRGRQALRSRRGQLGEQHVRAGRGALPDDGGRLGQRAGRLPGRVPAERQLGEYGKPNCNGTAGCLSSLSAATLTGLWRDAENTSLMVGMQLPALLHEEFGAPSQVWMNLTASAPGRLCAELSVFEKTATRMAEAGLFGFSPVDPGQGATAPASQWAMDKLGEWVLPEDPRLGGDAEEIRKGLGTLRRPGGTEIQDLQRCFSKDLQPGLHGVSSGISFARTDGSSLFVETLDASIVSWGGPDPYPTPVHEQPDWSRGANFVLWDNLWNTNYIFWWPYDTPPDRPHDDFRFRFVLHFREHDADLHGARGKLDDHLSFPVVLHSTVDGIAQTSGVVIPSQPGSPEVSGGTRVLTAARASRVGAASSEPEGFLEAWRAAVALSEGLLPSWRGATARPPSAESAVIPAVDISNEPIRYSWEFLLGFLASLGTGRGGKVRVEKGAGKGEPQPYPLGCTSPVLTGLPLARPVFLVARGRGAGCGDLEQLWKASCSPPRAEGPRGRETRAELQVPINVTSTTPCEFRIGLEFGRVYDEVYEASTFDLHDANLVTWDPSIMRARSFCRACPESLRGTTTSVRAAAQCSAEAAPLTAEEREQRAHLAAWEEQLATMRQQLAAREAAMARQVEESTRRACELQDREARTAQLEAALAERQQSQDGVDARLAEREQRVVRCESQITQLESDRERSRLEREASPTTGASRAGAEGGARDERIQATHRGRHRRGRPRAAEAPDVAEAARRPRGCHRHGRAVRGTLRRLRLRALGVRPLSRGQQPAAPARHGGDLPVRLQAQGPRARRAARRHERRSASEPQGQGGRCWRRLAQPRTRPGGLRGTGAAGLTRRRGRRTPPPAAAVPSRSLAR
ncbi:unnamed protein product, partial [Prorocentrum cordatum]